MDEGKKNFLVFELPPLAWMLAILGLSSIPGKHLPKIYLLHPIAHFVEYTILGVLLTRGFTHLKIRLSVLQLSVLSVVLIILFAFFDEWRQSFVPGRSCDLNTVFLDTIYAILGVSLYDEAVLLLSGKKRKAGT